jgi:hypothetical protein
MAQIIILDFSRIILSMKLINSENNKSLILPQRSKPMISKANAFNY